MINGNKVLAVIPARGGSKGVPRKNIRDVAGKPLIAWTIDEAKKSKFIDKLILSSDDEEIMAVAKSYGCEVPFQRPSELALDETPGMEPILHAIDVIKGYDYIVELQPTSPLRTVEDIDGCIEECVTKGWNACVTLTESPKSPYWMYTLDSVGFMSHLMQEQASVAARRQDLPPIYVLNGAVYVASTKWLTESKTFLSDTTGGHIMPYSRSLDIDTELDIFLATHILSSYDRL